jgi:hypothetical protein
MQHFSADFLMQEYVDMREMTTSKTKQQKLNCPSETTEINVCFFSSLEFKCGIDWLREETRKEIGMTGGREGRKNRQYSGRSDHPPRDTRRTRI